MDDPRYDSTSDDDLDSDPNLEEDSLIHHVVLPRVLPNKTSENLHETELELIDQFVKIAKDFKEWIPPKTLELLLALQSYHHGCKPLTVWMDINKLGPGDNFAMFIRRQHCAIMIHVPPDEIPNDVQNVIVAAFPGRLHSSEIYHRESDIEFNYPQPAVKVKFSQMLRSPVFSNQLCVLNEKLPAGHKHLDCVSKWLITLLMDEQSTAAEFPVITKKIRDEVWGNSEVFFRRSSFYMSVKAMLQHSLAFQLGAGRCKSVYKMFMLKFLIAAYMSPNNKFNIDLLSQVMAKLARRIEKLSDMRITDDMTSLYNSTIDEAKKTIKMIRKKIDAPINKMHEKNAKLPVLTGLNFEEDISYKMPKLEKYLEERKKTLLQIDDGFKPPKYITYDRYFKSEMPSVDCLESINKVKREIDHRIFWIDFERIILYQAKIGDDHWNAEDLRSWSFAYANFAEIKYKNNQLFISRMLLVRLKIIAMLDAQATKECPMLLKHRIGLKSQMIDYLLLPQSTDMRIALEIESYLRDRNQNADDPSLIEEKEISESSFSVKFAKESAQMQQIRDAILAKDNDKKDRKIKKWNEECDKANELKRQAERLDHENDSHWASTYKDTHSKTCKKCALKREAKEVCVKPHEHLLPSNETDQYAIVFELKIPDVIACLRDVLYGFAEFCFGEPKLLKIKGSWTESKLSEYNSSKSEHVKLGYTVKQNTDGVSVVDNSLRKVLLKNISDCRFHAKHRTMPSFSTIRLIKNACTLQAQDEYVGHQWALHSTEHTENQVLSSQSKCGTDMTLSEYKNFGTLRSDGNRLQIRKLYALIATEALSFEKEAVLALVMQTLWECEVSGEGGFIRESHIDFSDTKFCDAMINLLANVLEQQTNNWMHPFKLFTVTLIAVRAFEINDTVALVGKIVKLLSSVREIALEWIDTIEKKIRDMANPDENTERNLRLKLIYIAIIGGLTFFIHPEHKYYRNIFANNTESRMAVASWLRFVISLKNNIRMYSSDEEKLPANLRMFLRLMESVGVSMEEKVTDVIERDADFIFRLVRKQWPRSEYAVFNQIYFDHEFPQILVVKATVDSTVQTVSIDIITGDFLVDSLPLSRLPSEVMHSNIYRWFFEDVVFEVQPDAQHNFSTVQKYNDCSYEFKMMGDNNSIIIIERKVNVFEKELIDESVLFSDDFPHDLVKNYSHWWDKNENFIEFRRRTFGKKHFSKETTVDYRLNLNNKHLIHEQTLRPMLDIKSNSYKNITKQLQRLEHPKHIHVLFFEETEEAKVELLRMNLRFTVKCPKKSKKHCDLISNEFNGMRVIREQKIDTLCGFRNGLVLESIKDDKKIILIPNGSIHTKNANMFADVWINTSNELRSPPFYQYQVDKFCCQLKSSNETHASWFYLAYLHAITSYGEIEPFTKMSGTERAIQILQSAFAWSSLPYDPEAIRILKDIAALTPLRNLDDLDIQSVTWPRGIPTHAAQDCFIYIAKKLLDDSQRLGDLHGVNSGKHIDLKTDMKMNERDHRRCQQLNPNLNVSNTFIKHKDLKTAPLQKRFTFSDDTRTVCILYHKQKFKVPTNLNLKQFLTDKTTEKTLGGLEHSERLKELLNHSVHEDFRDLWISLYDAAVRRKLTSDQFAMILSFFAHREENIKPILALQAVVVKPNEFQHINPPANSSFDMSAGNFTANAVSTLLKRRFKQHIRDPALITIIDDITASVKSYWKARPCESFNFTQRWTYKDIDFAAANVAVNEKLKTWYALYELNTFIRRVEARLQSLTGLNSIRVPQCLSQPPKAKKWSKFLIDIEAKIRKNIANSDVLRQHIEEAKDVWQMNTTESLRSAHDWWKIYKKVCDSAQTSHLIQAGIFPRIAPSLLLPKITDANIDSDLRCLIGAFAIEITREQRESRIQAYSRRSDQQAALDREEKNEPHTNWSPYDYPEWLLFEIEQNVTIRRIQIEIAKRMIEPPEIASKQKHSVMQLNMGEGKTAVIVPILAARLADGTQACQIIVLKSLFARNLKSLRQYLGGMLDRRMYVFPCRRDMPIESHAHDIMDIYEECKREKGVILTLPEYRLSFQLKIYESIASQLKTGENRNFTIAKQLLDLHKWTNTNVRSILDESDAILNAKYQLIYTVGNQKQPDGDSHRWLVAQALLKRVPIHMHRLYTEYGKEKVEFGHNHDGNCRTDIFTPCRILDDSVYDALKDALIDDFFAGRIDIDFPGIDDAKKPSLKYLLSNKAIDRSTLRTIEVFSEEKQNIILILSGLLRFEVLKLALTKRWRVNYGVDVKGQRKMAIPFKAKDVAAEMTEFGHPDVAVCLTQMSYYYSGLSDAQLYQVFNILENSPDKADIYAKWIKSIPNDRLVPSIESYSGVNLDDPDQRDGLLFPLFQYNMNVIDFWLSNVVYLQELKIFEKKLMCTAWDLCSDSLEHRVTGFSGTNDTKNILPITIAQNDLAELENTNAEMRQILMDPRNMVYQNPAKMRKAHQILQELVSHDISVLLDSGALMLELNNKEVAVEWLKLALNRNAAVYFDETDTLQTIDRNGIVIEFDYSVYREDLSDCVVFLDDVHTRGTDLKFPADWMACVTLSGDITRDKTVQACMRMRQLKTTQSIMFWASNEADIRLRKLSSQRRVESRHVMEFIENNSRLFETTNMAHWTAGAVNYTKKLIGHKMYDNFMEHTIDANAMEVDTDDKHPLEKLYENCVDDDYVKLKTIYGEKEEVLLRRIVWDKFGDLAFSCSEESPISEFTKDMQNGINAKLLKLAPKMKRFIHTLDDEQEKELEQEIEEQMQIERPRCAQALKPHFDDRLEQLVLEGAGIGSTFDDMKADGALLSIVASLSNTQMFEFCENNDDAWASHLLVTKDFTMVIENESQACNDFLRPVCWVACIKNAGTKDVLILLSSFECNQLIPAFRKSENATLFMYRARLSNLHSNLIREPGLQVTGMTTTSSISVEDEVQIGVYSGMMYFADEEEQHAYCEFLGLIPRPWTHEQTIAFEDGNIDESGYVPIRKRNYPEAISQCVSQCKFKSNPTDLAIKLIKAHHQKLPKDSHVASILNRGIKSFRENDAMDTE
ncbi:uncharacterized protein LOC129567922 [Sitodiplosis mosellana]|uniref:uncharacterized protein LOC129567922 n=1 Tax=Sitodiplosis mosellana TaxID=263140 RepID=UPI002443A2D9|nr:uncharacterized protein LOC129567922 [Sitodiplosis mosellana]